MRNNLTTNMFPNMMMMMMMMPLNALMKKTCSRNDIWACELLPGLPFTLSVKLYTSFFFFIWSKTTNSLSKHTEGLLNPPPLPQFIYISENYQQMESAWDSIVGGWQT